MRYAKTTKEYLKASISIRKCLSFDTIFDKLFSNKNLVISTLPNTTICFQVQRSPKLGYSKHQAHTATDRAIPYTACVRLRRP